MLKTNLSTRPFYNERRVHAAAALVALVVVAATAWNVAQLVTLSARRTELTTAIGRDEQAAADLRRRADALERSVDPAALEAVAQAAREANLVIEQRAFSWTSFLNRLEETLPPDVMLASVAPQIERGNVVLTMTVVGRRAEDVDDFMERLEASGDFADITPIVFDETSDGLRRVTLQGRHR
jgi:hypothetical protein